MNFFAPTSAATIVPLHMIADALKVTGTELSAEVEPKMYFSDQLTQWKSKNILFVKCK